MAQHLQKEGLMIGSRTECVANARKLLRTFASAPDQHRRAHEIVHELARIQGLAPTERAEITALGTWLAEKPSSGQLKARCEALLARFK